MKYKVVDFVSDIKEEETGTCELCMGTAYVEEGYFVLEDENGEQHEIPCTAWSWGDYFEIHIGNIVDFSAWLQGRDEPAMDEIENAWSWLDGLVTDYYDEMEDEE